MENPVKLIKKFNEEANLLVDGYSDFRESSFQIEEALEGFPERNLKLLANTLGIQESDPKSISRMIVLIANTCDATSFTDETDISDVGRLDKALDAIVFAYGSIFKLGLTPQQANHALMVVAQHNLKKLHMPKDEHGKLTKPDDFVGPEAELQKILDKRGM